MKEIGVFFSQKLREGNCGVLRGLKFGDELTWIMKIFLINNVAENASHREEYRQLLANSYAAIRAHNGSKKTQDVLFDQLTALEQWMGKTFAGGANRAPDNVEALAASAFRRCGKPQTVNDLLDRSSQRISRVVRGELSPKEIAEALNIEYKELESPLLPTNGKGHIGHVGGHGKIKKPEYHSKIQYLIALLQRNGISTDDICLISGINLPNMKRQESYTLVQIHPSTKDILVCNEFGQATYASEVARSVQDYLTLSKEEVKALLGMHKIVFRTKNQWERDVGAVIASKPISLAQLQDEDWLVNAIVEECGYPVNFGWSSDHQRKTFRFHGMDLRQISHRLRIGGDPIEDKDDYWILLSWVWQKRILETGGTFGKTYEEAMRRRANYPLESGDKPQ